MALTAIEPKYVLVAEDDDEIRQIISDCLKSESDGLNLMVVEARDGEEAIAHASRQEFHCVITDLKMPRTSGEDFIRTLQRQSVNANTPTLVVSGHIGEEFGQRFKNVRSFPKPFQPEDLARAVVREIRLGRLDDRVPIPFVNPFVEGAKKLIMEDLELVPQLESPVVKKAGDPMLGDVHCNMVLTTGPIQVRFTLSFDRSWMDHMKAQYFSKRNLQWATMSFETVARQTANAIFANVAPSLEALMGDTPRLASCTVLTPEMREVSELGKVPGVIVTMRMDQGRVFFGALARVRARRV